MIELMSSSPGETSPAVPAAPARAPVAPPPAAPENVDEPPLWDVAAWLRSAPPWLLSAIVHMTAMIFLGLMFFQSKIEDDVLLNAGYTEDATLPLTDDLDVTQIDTVDIALDEHVLTAQDLPRVDDPFSTPDASDVAFNPVLATGAVMPTTIGIALTGREAGMKEALLKAYGGTGKTEGAVALGLGWLANRQLRTGEWSLTGPYDDGARDNNDAAATAMALLAFQGAGYTPQGDPKHPFTPVVRRGWNQLLKKMDKDGKFFHEVRSNQQLYTQAMCTIALCELFGMTDDYQYRDLAQQAVDYCVKIQSPEGGWRYQPGVDSDMSVTGWFVMALQSARMAGLEVPSPTLERVSGYLDTVARDGGSRYAYQARAGATLTLTAEGLLCRMYLGWERDDPRLQNGVGYLLENPPVWSEQNVYYWYYATQVLHHVEGSPWRTWNEQMRQLLPEQQVRRGRERGSWDPGGDRWGGDGGRLYVTCLSLYVLEVYYRHLPLYQTGVIGGGY